MISAACPVSFYSVSNINELAVHYFLGLEHPPKEILTDEYPLHHSLPVLPSCGQGTQMLWDLSPKFHLKNIMYEMSCQSRFDAQYWMLGAGALGRPRGRVWGGRREEGSGWGTHVYLWQIHFDIWQNQYSIVKLNKIKLKKQTNKPSLTLLPLENMMSVLGFVT